MGETAAAVRNENEWGILLCYFTVLVECQHLALGKVYFAECRIVEHSTKIVLFFINSLPSVPKQTLVKKRCAECLPTTLDKEYLQFIL
jgi:hypothetical protein